MTFFEKLEIWKEEYVILRHVFLNFKDYKNLNFNFPIGIILILFVIAFPIAVFLINKKRNTISFAMKQLVRHEAFDEESAKSLSALRLSNLKSFKKMLTSSGQLSSMIKIVGYEKPSYEDYIKAKKEKKALEKPNFEEMKIFISEDSREKAETIAESEITPIWKPILIASAGVIILVLLFIFMPEILEFLNNSI